MKTQSMSGKEGEAETTAIMLTTFEGQPENNNNNHNNASRSSFFTAPAQVY
jgi:hypothetical protein